MKNKKILFACDLDNTLIHSHKHKHEDDICVEILDGKEQSFITPKTKELLLELSSREDIQIVPVTTRSIEQYSRIKLPIQTEYALVCNGSLLLHNGISDEQWLAETQALISPYRAEMERVLELCGNMECFRTARLVNDMFVFAHFDAEYDIAQLKDKANYGVTDETSLTAQLSERKLYFFPPAADKGSNVKRLAEKTGYSGKIIAAGDSVIDFPMLEIADTAFLPDNKTADLINNRNKLVCPKNKMFSEFILISIRTLDKAGG